MLSTLVPMIGTPAASSALGQVQRRLPAELHDHPLRLHPVADVEHVLGRQRLEEEVVAGVVVGGDGLRVRVDHDGLEAGLAQREGGLAAAVVELDPLADAVRAAAEDHDAVLAGWRAGLVLGSCSRESECRAVGARVADSDM